MDSTSERAAASVQSARGRHRRPSGEPPPLPRPTWWRASVITLAATIVFGVVVAFLYDDTPDAPCSTPRWAPAPA